MGKLTLFVLLLGTHLTPSALAQQNSQPATVSGEAKIGRTKCHDQPYVVVTADTEQSIPLKEVARIKCNEEVTLLSDWQAYTVRVRTAAGQIGYVTRYELTIDTSTKNPVAPAQSEMVPKPKTDQSAAHAAALLNRETQSSPKPRIYVSDTKSWTESGGFANPSSIANGNLYGGYNPEMADVYQDFTSDCPALLVTQEKSQADYAVLFDKGTGKKGLTGLGGLVKVNKVTVLSRSGETVLTETSGSADTAVRRACSTIAQKSGANSIAGPDR